ncbi:3'-5' exonuclease [Crenalkalicoccus roseus]|uniref:3'-5' exonuclease n=1 Tax=Crenalkalicoccus roseus TaxID=1485588 RepID=UPI001EFFD7E1|nr:exonuclease domain-containing protein [Crenalkalicoccus roseus]
MSGRRRLGLRFLALGALGAALAGLGATLPQGAPPSAAVTPALVVAATVLAAWKLVEAALLRRLAALAAETNVLAHAEEEARLPEARFAALAPLPQAVNALAERLFQTRRRVEEAVAQSTARVEEQKSRLAAILNDLHDGVLVCNLEHQILLYNRRALALLGLRGGLGLGRNLLPLVAREPVLHALERLTRASGQDTAAAEERHAQVLTALADGRALLQGRMGLVVTGGQVTGYVLTLADATAELATLGKCDALLRQASEELRQPIANLRAAAETLADNPELPPEGRAEFERVILGEAQSLSTRLEAIAAEYRSVAGRLWPMGDILSSDLVTLVAFRAAQAGAEVRAAGEPQWLHADSHSLVILFGHLIARLGAQLGVREFEMAAEGREARAYLDLSWHGPPVPMAALSVWAEDPLEGALGGLSLGDVLQRHHSDLWSEEAGGGRARIRMPLARASRARGAVPEGALSRPEFFDFDLLHQPLVSGALGRTPLDRLTCVVFDTETTGLNPSGGDRLISIGAVRIVNGRILTGETFSALINPGRSIPAASTRFHGITDAMVRDCPPAEAVLPEFRAFVDEAVLVAHNAAFDLKFLRMAEKAAGVRFDNPVLDTMVLSLFLQGEEGEHSLDALAARLGVPVEGRHSALGDAMATARIFLRFVDMLKERGIHTLDDAVRSSNMQVELRARGHAF